MVAKDPGQVGLGVLLPREVVIRAEAGQGTESVAREARYAVAGHFIRKRRADRRICQRKKANVFAEDSSVTKCIAGFEDHLWRKNIRRVKGVRTSRRVR